MTGEKLNLKICRFVTWYQAYSQDIFYGFIKALILQYLRTTL